MHGLEDIALFPHSDAAATADFVVYDGYLRRATIAQIYSTPALRISTLCK
jgi:hypothetical protein